MTVLQSFEKAIVRQRRARRKTAALVLAACALSATLAAAERPPDRTLSAVYYRSQEELNLLGSRFDVWEVVGDQGYAVVLLRPDQAAELRQAGLRSIPLAEVPGTPQAKLDSRFFFYDDFITNARDRYLADLLPVVAQRYPGLTELIDIGEAWEAGQGGHRRDVTVLRITSENPAFGPIEDKPAFFLFATIHAREVAVPELALRYAAYLLPGYRGRGGYGKDADVTWLVNRHVVYILVMQNPDGHAKNEADTGAYWRKNTDTLDGCPFAGADGVDLNRNHSFLWGCCGGSSGNSCDETYRGSSRASEPETQAFETFFAQVMKDQNGPNGDDEIPQAAPADTTGIFISLHSYGDLVLWPWGHFDYGLPPNDAELEKIGRKFAFFNGFNPVGFIGYLTDGTTDTWVYGKFGIPAFTFEVGSGGACGGFFPDYRCLDGYNGRSFWNENGPAFLYAHKIARAPYTTVYGPDTLSPAGSAPPGGAVLDATAVVEDRRRSGEARRAIVAAEAFVDAAGPDGTGAPLAPADGSWGGTREVVEGQVPIAGLPPGRHLVLIRGRTDNGTWGPLSAAFFDLDASE